jgi:hypothetical protein
MALLAPLRASLHGEIQILGFELAQHGQVIALQVPESLVEELLKGKYCV